MSIEQISPSAARAAQAQGAVYVDVRTTAEYAKGHPVDAVNVPLLEADEDAGEPLPNPDFLRVMQANFRANQAIVLGCQSGRRSAQAAARLQAFGYTRVLNMLGGFGGKRDTTTGEVATRGWLNHGLPVAEESQPGASYAVLLAKADGSAGAE